MKVWLPIIVLCLTFTATWAGLDDDPDSIGVYFETTGFVDWVPSLPLYVPSSVYCLLLNVTAPVKGYEFTCRLEENPNLIRGSTTLPAGAVDADASVEGFAVGLATAIPPGPIVTLATMTFMQIGPVQSCFYLGPASIPSLPGNLPVIDGGPGYGLRHAYFGRGGGGLPSGGVGILCEVLFTDEASSFGGVKSLFR